MNKKTLVAQMILNTCLAVGVIAVFFGCLLTSATGNLNWLCLVTFGITLLGFDIAAILKRI